MAATMWSTRTNLYAPLWTVASINPSDRCFARRRVARLPSAAVASDPSPDLKLAPLTGPSLTVGELLTMFDLCFVALDPFTHESAWILETAGRILTTFDQADVRVAWLVTSTADECRQFLGPWGRDILTFADPDRA